MNRSRLPHIALAALGVLAVGIAAATLTETQGGSAGGPGFSGGNNPEAVPIPYFPELLAVLFAVLLVIVALFLVRNWRELLVPLIAVVVLAGGLLLFVYYCPRYCPRLPIEPLPFDGNASVPPPINETANGSITDDGDSQITDVTPPTLLLLALFGVLIVGTVVAVLRERSEPDSDAEVESEVDSTTAALGRAAGRAADRLEEEVAHENEVYRAWLEMTELLDVSRSPATTAGEFADAAIAAGMAPDDVHDLSRLFEDVRYGDYEASEERERRALETLRRIEHTYAPEDDDG